MLAIRPVRMNVFVKPNEQSQVYLSYAMARKGRIYPTFSLSQMSNDELAYSLPWREKVHANEYWSRQGTDLSPCPPCHLWKIFYPLNTQNPQNIPFNICLTSVDK